MRTLILTSDKTMGALRAYAHQHMKYWPGQEVLVAGYSSLPFALPAQFEYIQIGRFEDYPVNRWTTALIKVLIEAMPYDELFIWTMDDFWLLRHVDTTAVALLETYMHEHPAIARMDLSTDRLYAANAGDVDLCGHLDILACHLPVPYHFSWQAGIWRREHLLRYLEPEETPWEAELRGSQRMNEAGALVCGTRQAPLRYLIAIQQGKLALDGGYQRPGIYIRPEDIAALRDLGYFEGLS